MFDQLYKGAVVVYKDDDRVILYNGSCTFNVYNSDGDECDMFMSSEEMTNDEAEAFARQYMEELEGDDQE